MTDLRLSTDPGRIWPGVPGGEDMQKSQGRMSRVKMLALAGAAALVLASAPAYAQQQQTFDIPATSLSAALRDFGQASGKQIIFTEDLVKGKRSPGLHGSFTPAEALSKILAGSGLQAKTAPSGAIMIVSAVGNASAAETAASRGEESYPAQSAAAADGSAEILVTGSRVRGGRTASPVITISAKQIREEGFTDLGEVIRSIPQNFSGGQNPGVSSVAAAGAGFANQNITGGASLNLRGLGPDATLTLLNGRRMAYDGYSQAVDISAIPVEAVERIEIVPDGASAIYGSDAVGGVGNVILRRDFEGLTIGARVGTATDGGLTTGEFTATAGHRWSNGGVLATVQETHTDPIYADQRRYTDQLRDPATIYPGSDLKSGLLSFHQSLGRAVEIRLDAFMTGRKQTHYYNLSTSYIHVLPKTTTAYVSPGIEVKLPDNWSLYFGGTWGKDDHTQLLVQTKLPAGTSRNVVDLCYCNTSYSYEVNGEGPLLSLPGGDVRLAIGAGYRRNEFRQPNYIINSVQIKGEDSVKFAYAELGLPLIGPESNVAAVRRLALTAAVRREDYNSFGSVTTPKIGVIYDPTADFTLKGSWGKSFKAPTLLQRYSPASAYVVSPSSYGGSGYPSDATLLFLDGGNLNLSPERARTWTTSLEFHPTHLLGLEAKLTWFDIVYTDRVVQPINNYSQALSNPIYSEFVDYSPSAAEQAALIAAADGFYNVVGVPYDPSKVVAILYTQYVNATRQHARGLDLSASYRFDLGASRMTIRGSGSLLDSSQQTVGTPAPYDLAGTLFNPAKFKSRIGAVWNHGGFSASVFGNYTSGVRDTVRNEKTRSFTTFDATLHYSTGQRGGAFSGLEVAFSAQNLFNRAPPFYRPASTYDIAPYDSTNYSAIGRFVSLSASKHF